MKGWGSFQEKQKISQTYMVLHSAQNSTFLQAGSKKKHVISGMSESRWSVISSLPVIRRQEIGSHVDDVPLNIYNKKRLGLHQ